MLNQLSRTFVKNSRLPLVLAAVISMTFSPVAFAAESENVCGLVPPNRLSFPVRAGEHVMSAQGFREILRALKRVYDPIMREEGSRFFVRPLWDDPTVNASATIEVSDRFRIINMYGGLARHPEMTPDAFLMVACHEVGHHLGGLPVKGISEWGASTEGQSDYYASLKCMRLVLSQFDNVAIMSKRRVDPVARRACLASFKNDAQEAALCMRSAMAGLALARALGSMRENPVLPSFTTPDRSRVPMTFEGHPEAQCRLDTYLAGAICRMPVATPVSYKNVEEGACNPRLGAGVLGQRPACWFFDPHRH